MLAPAVTTIRSPPSADQFVLLADYQAQTPASFVDEKPVLHLQLHGATVSVPEAQRAVLALFATDGRLVAQGEEASVEQTVDVFVTSDNLILFSQALGIGLAMAYPSIAIHAIKQGPASALVWMQLQLSDGGAYDDDYATLELTIAPPLSASSAPDASASVASQLYDALSTCSDLHPDSRSNQDDDEEEQQQQQAAAGAVFFADDAVVPLVSSNGALPPPMPGSGGWITAENAHQFFDEDGNWLGRRAHEDSESGPGEQPNGDDPDKKRPRLD